jgi:hypothetical protein
LTYYEDARQTGYSAESLGQELIEQLPNQARELREKNREIERQENKA